jgi:peptidyl-prolyl cis-trans isomerase B (cyclophilin B)
VPPSDKRQRQKENTRLAREARERALRRQRQRKAAIRFSIIAIPFIALFVFLSVRGGDDKKASPTTTSKPAATTTTVAIDPSKTYATIKTNFGNIMIEMDTKNAPKGSAHFVQLAKSGFYDGLKWHRAAKDFVIQGGDPKGDGTGGAGHPIVAEVPKDQYPLGSLAAAKTANDPAGTFDSQFFIVTGSQGATLPNDYARFGKVVSGLDVAQKIEALAPASGDGAPTKPATIEKITIKEPTATSTTTAAATTSTT